jgi:hypothetical protein
MAVNHNRKMLNIEQEGAYFDGLSLKQLKVRVDELIVAYGEDASVEWHTYPYDDNRHLYVFKEIPETDEQMETRIAKEEEWEQNRMNYERQEFERLQKVYGEKK